MTKRKVPSGKLQARTKSGSSAVSLRQRVLGPAAEAFGKEFEKIGTTAGQVAANAVSLISELYGSAISDRRAFGAAVRDRFERIPSGVRTEPDPRIAFGALQGAALSSEDITIRDLFLNLLASDMNISNKDYVHPSFVQIISQMDALDASFFKLFCQNGEEAKLEFVSIRPLPTSVYVENGPREGYVIEGQRVTFAIEGYNSSQLLVSCDNLKRLGLIEMERGKFIMNKKTSSIVNDTLEAYRLDQFGVEFQCFGYGLIPTDVGQRLAISCLDESDTDHLRASHKLT